MYVSYSRLHLSRWVRILLKISKYLCSRVQIHSNILDYTVLYCKRTFFNFLPHIPLQRHQQQSCFSLPSFSFILFSFCYVKLCMNLTGNVSVPVPWVSSTPPKSLHFFASEKCIYGSTQTKKEKLSRRTHFFSNNSSSPYIPVQLPLLQQKESTQFHSAHHYKSSSLFFSKLLPVSLLALPFYKSQSLSFFILNAFYSQKGIHGRTAREPNYPVHSTYYTLFFFLILIFRHLSPPVLPLCLPLLFCKLKKHQESHRPMLSSSAALSLPVVLATQEYLQKAKGKCPAIDCDTVIVSTIDVEAWSWCDNEKSSSLPIKGTFPSVLSFPSCTHTVSDTTHTQLKLPKEEKSFTFFSSLDKSPFASSKLSLYFIFFFKKKK